MQFYNYLLLILLITIYSSESKGEIKKFIPSEDENYFLQIRNLCVKQGSSIATDKDELEEKINSILSAKKYFTYLNIIDQEVTGIISFYFFTPHEEATICYDNDKKDIQSQIKIDKIHIPLFCIERESTNKEDVTNFLENAINMVSKETGRNEYYFGIFKKNQTFQNFLLSNRTNKLTVKKEENNYCTNCQKIKRQYEKEYPYEYFSVSVNK